MQPLVHVLVGFYLGSFRGLGGGTSALALRARTGRHTAGRSARGARSSRGQVHGWRRTRGGAAAEALSAGAGAGAGVASYAG